MPRPLRIEYKDAYYHVMNRGRGRRSIYPDTAYYEDFLKCLHEAHLRFAVQIHAYCLMGNHYHLLIKTPRGNLSRVMRHIDGVYTQRHNRRKKAEGALFRGRYKAILIDASRYLLPLSRHIHRNPIEQKKPLVKNLTDYPWSSYGAYTKKCTVFDWLKRDVVYDELGSTRKYSAYKAYVEAGNDDETARFYQLKNTPSVRGDKRFKEQAHRRAQSLEIEIGKKGLRHPIPLLRIMKAVAVHYEVSVNDIRVAKRGQGITSISRWMAMKLCQEVGGAKLTEIADEFNVGHYSTVSQTIGRLNTLMQTDRRAVKAYNMLSKGLAP